MTTPREYLSRLNSSVIRLGLAPVTRLLASLQNPQDAYASILIGGTNGKGSIAAMTSSILIEAGYRVGLYTSPHLVDLRERIRVNGEMIGEGELDDLIDEVRGCVTEEVTYFEVLTAAAFLHFCRKKVDIAVLEVGLGGRLDATNVVEPLASIISNISLEHTEYLGKCLRDIATEKAGIIPRGGVCVTAAKQKSVLGVFEDVAHGKEAMLYHVGRNIRTRRHRDGTFSYYGIYKNYCNLRCPLPGRHQIDNAALSLSALEITEKTGYPLSDEAIRRGLEKAVWEGRLEVLRRAPGLVIDGGHNAAGITVLCRSLRENFSYRHLILVFAVLRDKNYSLMLKKISPLAHKIIITQAQTERSVPAEELAMTARRYHDEVEIVKPSREALARALYMAGKDDLVCVTGSLYLVGEVKRDYTELIS